MKILHSINGAPPVGGVTKSVENLHSSLLNTGHKSFLLKDLFKNLKYDIGHIHASNIYKRLFLILIFKIFCRKVIFTVHGSWLDKNIINKLCIMLSSGIIILNEKLYKEWGKSKYSNKFRLLPILYKEGIGTKDIIAIKESSKIRILLYSSRKEYKNGQEVYGIEFALNTLSHLSLNFDITLVDLDGGYKNVVNSYTNKLQIRYFDYPINFEHLLQECDIYLRPTCMDGSSVAIQEALLLGKRVIASDIVDRTQGVELYKHLNSDSLLDVLNNDRLQSNTFTPPSVKKYVEFIDSL
ncbi:hypothetical protein [Photobacterium damselae]|uniref:hypothetical protein n=1 Tax=Photobacterium damselae TaxID=38293 RepID=UPI004067830A